MPVTVAQYDAMKIAQLRAVIEAVEWVDRPNGRAICPWCYEEMPHRETEVNQFGRMVDFGEVGGHGDDCPRQLALASVQDAKAD
jgi:hypothetical protein